MERTWTWTLAAPRADAWSLLADTARFNEGAGFPRHAIREEPQPDGSVVYMADCRIGHYRLRWEDIPVDWVSAERFTHVRRFVNGPFRSLAATLVIADSDGGCRVDYTLDVRPRNLLGRALLALGFMRGSGKTIAAQFESVRRHLADPAIRPYAAQPAPRPPDAERRVSAAVAAIEATAFGHGLAARLADEVLTAQENDVRRIRPLALTRRWAVAPRAVIECCLQAVRSGLLELRWDLLCPNCRAAKVSSTGLDALPHGAHCASCNVDYDRDFSRNVECSFVPNPAIRPLDGGEFCLFGPMSTPHVVIQQTLEAGEERVVAFDTMPGPYRVRTLHPTGASEVDHAGGAFPSVIGDGETVVARPPSRPGTVVLRNTSARRLILVVESRAWVADALTADRLTALQAFRDLFSEAVLRPGDDVGIARIALLFTDLRGSTALYARIGDAKAYRRVRTHFAYLAAAVREHDGAIVKTIGDAVMAAFVDPAEALRAAIATQQNVAALNHGDETPLVIKLGLHVGPCIAVTLNGRLDYFGTTVNLAARLQGQSHGGDVVMSDELARDPAVATILDRFETTTEAAAIKGFAATVPFRRFAPAALAAGPSIRLDEQVLG
ncbi:MAG: adenylate/guanylate cyclase domain-containing protein [Alphaproteobacteria bacterium]|nr:adenylate/guanylate cyclase domain-containing protein [Alphaproteobacteria bacterium]